jgi:hypothetical protein
MEDDLAAGVEVEEWLESYADFGISQLEMRLEAEWEMDECDRRAGRADRPPREATSSSSRSDRDAAVGVGVCG